MGWSTTAPTLPSGVEWETQGEYSDYHYRAHYNYFKIDVTVYIARLSGKNFAVKVVSEVLVGTYGSYSSFGNYYLRATINGVQDAADNSFGSALGTQTFYYTGEASADAPIKIEVGYAQATECTFSLTAPKLRGVTAYVNVNGTWKEATMFVNVGGTWKEAQAKINAGGEWK